MEQVDTVKDREWGVLYCIAAMEQVDRETDRE
jgi:hypothetical protein